MIIRVPSNGSSGHRVDHAEVPAGPLQQSPAAEREVAGYVTSYMLFENDSDVCWLFAVFEDFHSYTANADSPEQDAQYREFRALMESDPEWHDGVIEQD